MALLLDQQFAPLPDTNEIATKTFLESVAHLPPFFDCLGSKVFAPIKADINGNITKIKAVYDSDPVKYETLQQILLIEKSIYGSEWPKVGATLALMWLKRGLRFIQILLQSLADGERDEDNPNLIRINITKAYDQALKRYHGWIVQKVFKKRHTPTNLLILSLAVADLFIGLIIMPVDAIKLIETCWYFGHTVCRFFLIIMVVSASLSNLVLIAVDRYIAVCHPLLYPKKITTAKTLMSICLCWFCSSTYNSVGLSYGSVDMSHMSEVCYGECPFIMTFALGVTDLIISFLFPCTLIITLYLRIFYVVHQQVKVINTLMKGGKSEMEVSVRRKSESKAALTLGIIVTVYLLCWIPYYILYLTETKVSTTTSDFLTWCLYINSCLNPLIYALFYPWFRTSVKHILTLQIFKPASSLVNVLNDHHS